MSSSTVSGPSGNIAPCLSMKSRNRSVVSSPAGVRGEEAVEVGQHVAHRRHGLGVLPGQRLRHPGELGVEHLALEHLGDLVVDRLGLGGVPVVRGQGPDLSGDVVGQRREVHLGEACGVGVLARQGVALGGQRLVEGGADVVERPGQVTAPAGGVAGPAEPVGQLVQAPALTEPAAEQVAQGLPGRAAREDVAPDLVQGRAHVERRRERVRPTVPGAVAEPVAVGGMPARYAGHGQAP